MIFDFALRKLKDGGRIRRKNWNSGSYLIMFRVPNENFTDYKQRTYMVDPEFKDGVSYKFSVEDIDSDDWEEV